MTAILPSQCLHIFSVVRRSSSFISSLSKMFSGKSYSSLLLTLLHFLYDFFNTVISDIGIERGSALNPVLSTIRKFLKGNVLKKYDINGLLEQEGSRIDIKEISSSELYVVTAQSLNSNYTAVNNDMLLCIGIKLGYKSIEPPTLVKQVLSRRFDISKDHCYGRMLMVHRSNRCLTEVRQDIIDTFKEFHTLIKLLITLMKMGTPEEVPSLLDYDAAQIA